MMGQEAIAVQTEV